MYRVKEGPGFGIWSSSLCAVYREEYSYIQFHPAEDDCKLFTLPEAIGNRGRSYSKRCFGHFGDP